MEKHLYFVRHGETDSNRDGIFRGEEAALTDQGREEALAVAERFTRIPIDALISSSYPRAFETANPISVTTGLPIEQSDLFVESRQPSVQIGLHRDDPEAQKISRDSYENFSTPGWRHSDEENFEDLKARSLAAVAFIENHPASRICIVTHGIFLRALFCAFFFGEVYDGRDFQRAFLSLSTSNTGISYIKTLEGRWKISSWNDSAHLG